jgi:hypothetical protein
MFQRKVFWASADSIALQHRRYKSSRYNSGWNWTKLKNLREGSRAFLHSPRDVCTTWFQVLYTSYRTGIAVIHYLSPHKLIVIIWSGSKIENLNNFKIKRPCHGAPSTICISDYW